MSLLVRSQPKDPEKVKLRGPKYPVPVEVGVPTVDLTTDERLTVPIDTSTTVDLDPDSVDLSPPKTGGVNRRKS